jgi:hypothetical protein
MVLSLFVTVTVRPVRVAASSLARHSLQLVVWIVLKAYRSTWLVGNLITDQGGRIIIIYVVVVE